MDKNQQRFFDSTWRDKNDDRNQEGRNTELIPTRDDVEQSRKLVEEIRRAVEKRDAPPSKADRKDR